MPTTREELQAIPQEWFQLRLSHIVTNIVNNVKETARSQTYYEHDVLSATQKSGVYCYSPRIVLEDVVDALKKELPGCTVAVHHEQGYGGVLAKVVIRIDWS